MFSPQGVGGRTCRERHGGGIRNFRKIGSGRSEEKKLKLEEAAVDSTTIEAKKGEGRKGRRFMPLPPAGLFL